MTRTLPCANINSLRQGDAYIRVTNYVVTAAADAVAPNGATASAGTVLNTQLDIYHTKPYSLCEYLMTFRSPDDFIQNGRRDLKESRDILNVNLFLVRLQLHTSIQKFCIIGMVSMLADQNIYNVHQISSSSAFLALYRIAPPVTSTSAAILDVCHHSLNTLRRRYNDHQFPDDIFRCIFSNENI